MTLTPKRVTETGAQGLPGAMLRQGSGQPGAATPANDGDAYHDTTNGVLYSSRQNGTWDLTKSVLTKGAQGVVGSAYAQPPEDCVNVSVAAGPAVGLTAAYSATTAAVPLNHVGTGLVATFVPDEDTAFLGGTFVHYGNPTNVNMTWALTNQTLGTTIYTTAATAGGSVNALGPFAATQYPMPAGYTYVWTAKLASSGSSYTHVQPYYAGKGQAGATLCFPGQPVSPGNGSITTTAKAMMVAADVDLQFYYKNPRAAYLYDGMLTNQTSEVATFAFAGFSQSVPASTSQPFGPFLPYAAPLTANTQYQWTLRTANATSGYACVQFSVAVQL